MVTSEIEIEAPPQHVWDVLADPHTYPEWLLGAKRIRGADPRFPEPGTSFDHQVGAGPVEVADSTSSIAADPPHRLELEVRARPVGIGRVVFEVEPTPTGSLVRFSEEATGGAAGAVKPVAEGLAKPRNEESLRRLKELVECGRPPAGTSEP